MSILIKGRSMPDNCQECVCLNDEYLYCQAVGRKPSDDNLMNTRPDWCPLIEIQSHGRLVDADSYAQEIRERHESASEWYKKATDDEILARAESAMITFTECFLTLKKMPTVIPAEESE